jgi:uncharacterized protein (DUF433 family)
MSTQVYPHIIADPEILSGKPVIEGTQVPASKLIQQVARGKSLDEVARESGVSVEDVRAALEYAAQRAGEPVAGTGSRNTTGQVGDLLTPAGAEEARRIGLDPAKLSPLGNRLLDQRAKIRAAGIPMLSWDQLDAELAEQRGTGAE